MYDERADIDHHRYEVGVVREKLRDFGASETGYDLAIDIGGGYGLHAPFLLEMASRLYVADRLDYVNPFGGNVGKAIADKFQRFDVELDRTRFEFHNADAQNLIYRDGLFDLVVSINAFEHIDDPEAAFREAIRITRPGGMMVLQFDPIWNSPFGHHLTHLGLEPWQHLVSGDELFQRQIAEAGAGDYHMNAYRTAMNRKPYSFYRKLFSGKLLQSFEKTSFEAWASSAADEPRSEHPNFATLVSRGFRPEELFVRGIRFIGRRRQSPRGFFG